jgi:hypothetical protein
MSVFNTAALYASLILSVASIQADGPDLSPANQGLTVTRNVSQRLPYPL